MIYKSMVIRVKELYYGRNVFVPVAFPDSSNCEQITMESWYMRFCKINEVLNFGHLWSKWLTRVGLSKTMWG